MLRLGGIDVQISYLELLDNNISARGALALGNSLGRHNNLSLLTLKLDYNTTLGDEGVANLCRGLRTNASLKQVGITLKCYSVTILFTHIFCVSILLTSSCPVHSYT